MIHVKGIERNGYMHVEFYSFFTDELLNETQISVV
jgi:hypothetical protein